MSDLNSISDSHGHGQLQKGRKLITLSHRILAPRYGNGEVAYPTVVYIQIDISVLCLRQVYAALPLPYCRS